MPNKKWNQYDVELVDERNPIQLLFYLPETPVIEICYVYKCGELPKSNAGWTQTLNCSSKFPQTVYAGEHNPI